MEQRDHGRDAGGAKLGNFVGIMRPIGFVPRALLRLETAPFDGEAVSVCTKIVHERDVLRDAIPFVIGATAGGGEMTLVFECGPIVEGIAAFDLVSGGGGAEEKSVGENVRGASGGVLKAQNLIGIGDGKCSAGNEIDYCESCEDDGTAPKKATRHIFVTVA
jgi:hypothetical protein